MLMRDLFTVANLLIDSVVIILQQHYDINITPESESANKY